MKKLAFGLVLGAAVLLTACATSRQKADKAYERRDWDTAVLEYEQALQGKLTAEERAQVEAWLDEARAKAVAVHMRRARSRLTAGDLPAAHDAVERALRHSDADDVAQLARTIREQYSASLREQGRAMLEAGRFGDAEAAAQQAQDVLPSADGARLLAEATAAAADWHRAEFERLSIEAQAALDAHDWASAEALLDEAHSHGETPLTRQQADLARHMAAAERAIRKGDYERAELSYRRALETGLDTEHVDWRMRTALPHDYRITIRGAAVVPFKPGTRRPWDGDGRTPGGARDFLLSLLDIPDRGSASRIERIGRHSGRFVRDRFDAPDLAPVVTVGHDVFDRTASVQNDTYTAMWDMELIVHAAADDAAEFELEVLDLDDSEDDVVGVWRTTLGELISIEGDSEYVFITPDGDLTAGGIAGVWVTIELVE